VIRCVDEGRSESSGRPRRSTCVAAVQAGMHWQHQKSAPVQRTRQSLLNRGALMRIICAHCCEWACGIVLPCLVRVWPDLLAPVVPCNLVLLSFKRCSAGLAAATA